MEEPQLRATYLQGNVQALAVLGADEEARVRAAIPDVIARIEGAARMEWLPYALDVAFTHAVFDVSGDGGVVATNQESFRASVDTGVLSPLVEGAIRVFGLSPSGILKISYRAWSLVTRGAGVFGPSELGEKRAVMEHRNLPPLFALDDVYLRGAVGICRGVLDLVRSEGTVEYQRVSDERVRYVLEWR